MTVKLSPIWNGEQFFDNDGFPLAGGLLFQYQAHSNSVKQDTFSDSTGDTPNENPMVLDSCGRVPNPIWLTEGSMYMLVVTKPDGETVLDNVNEVSAGPILS